MAPQLRKKTSPENVRGIRYAAQEEQVPLAEVAKIYNLNRTTVWRIVNRKRHRKVQ